MTKERERASMERKLEQRRAEEAEASRKQSRHIERAEHTEYSADTEKTTL